MGLFQQSSTTDQVRKPLQPRSYSDQRLRVFISSLPQELSAEQMAAFNAIRDLRLRPLAFEEEPLSFLQKEVYRASIEQSHIYVGLFWESYGSIVSGQTSSELEETFLLSSTKPRLIYVKESLRGRDPLLEQFLGRVQRAESYCYRFFSTLEELIELIKNDIMQLLSETFGLETHPKVSENIVLPDYLQSLHSEMEQSGFVERGAFLQMIQEKLMVNTKMLLVGDPGIGKTYLLGLLGKGINAIYISLRNKTTQQVCAYLANHLTQRRNQRAQNLFSEDEARSTLQQELANSRAILLIDDTDSNPSVAQMLFGLEFFGCHALFSTCSPHIGRTHQIEKIQVPPLISEEVVTFLHLHNIDLPPGEFQKLMTASQGNPLYLFYFRQRHISPLPKNLEMYQQALWERLLPLQQEALAFLAYSLKPLSVANLHNLLTASQPQRTMMETKALLSSAVPFIHQREETYHFFHPRFSEHIRIELAHDGLSFHYHRLLGEYAMKEQQTVSAAYHFFHADDARMKDYLLPAAKIVLVQGNYLLTEQLLLKSLLFPCESTPEEIDDLDIYRPYEQCLSQLLRQIEQSHPRYRDVLIYQQRLQENIEKARSYGDTETRMAERAEILALLNELTLALFNQPFSNLYQEDDIEQNLSMKEKDSKKYHQEAMVRYLLAQVYLELGRYKDARREADLSIGLFKEVDEEGWKIIVEQWSYLLLLEEGKAEEAIEALEHALKVNILQDTYTIAILEMNLAYAYLQISRFRTGAEAAKRAFSLFKQLGDDRGVYTSLATLAGHIGQLGAYSLQKKYAEQIIRVATDQHWLRLRAVGLNVLAGALRNLGDPSTAQMCLEECIRISQEIGSVETEVLNIINLGNAFRDQNRETQAEQAYTEALTKARQFHLSKHEAHALELLAETKFLQNSYEEALQLGLKALEIQQALNDHLRIAVTQSKLARCSLQLERSTQAAIYHEGSGMHYEIAELWSEAAYHYGQAAGLWNVLMEKERSWSCVYHQVICSFRCENVNEAETVIKRLSPDERDEKAGEWYLQGLQLFLQQKNPVALTSLLYNFSAYCKFTTNAVQKRVFKQGLESIVTALEEKNSSRVLNALAIGIEQANQELLSSFDGEALARNIANTIDHLYYRHENNHENNEETDIWTIGFDWAKPLLLQIICPSNDLVARRLATALALILLANQQQLEDVIIEYGGNQETDFTFYVFAQNDLPYISPDDFRGTRGDAPLSAVIITDQNPHDNQPSLTALVLHEDYKQMHNWAIQPWNKAFVWILMLAHNIFVAHCTHQNYETAPGLAKKGSAFCHKVLDAEQPSEDIQDFLFDEKDF